METAAELFRAHRQQEREAVQRFVAAVQAGDMTQFRKSFGEVLAIEAGPRAMRAIARLQSVPEEIRIAARQAWQENGDDIRSEVDDDLALLDGFWKLLPPYAGPPVTLYRGDSWFNRCHRTYGLAWSSNREIANGFALGWWRAHKGGSVLLVTDAPTDAVLFAYDVNDHYGEQEYLVDRRCLRTVRIITRYSQVSIDRVRDGVET